MPSSFRRPCWPVGCNAPARRSPSFISRSFSSLTTLRLGSISRSRPANHSLTVRIDMHPSAYHDSHEQVSRLRATCCDALTSFRETSKQPVHLSFTTHHQPAQMHPPPQHRCPFISTLICIYVRTAHVISMLVRSSGHRDSANRHRHMRVAVREGIGCISIHHGDHLCRCPCLEVCAPALQETSERTVGSIQTVACCTSTTE
mmetsp:Transcript_11949/g.32882  ORF Transcript_11949/g.32882 Transcript_11949/m.32882 type:complete len:202 (+) Transcript_11949:232-837(+)